MRDILRPSEEIMESEEFTVDAALALAENPRELFKMENLARLDDFLAHHAYDLSPDQASSLTDRLAQEDVADAPISLETFAEVRQHLENISTYLDSVSVATRLGSRLGAKVLQADISTALQNQDFQSLDAIRHMWTAKGLPSIFARSLYQYAAAQSAGLKLELLRNPDFMGLMSKDEPAVGRMAAVLRTALENTDGGNAEQITTIPGTAQAA